MTPTRTFAGLVTTLRRLREQFRDAGVTVDDLRNALSGLGEDTTRAAADAEAVRAAYRAMDDEAAAASRALYEVEDGWRMMTDAEVNAANESLQAASGLGRVGDAADEVTIPFERVRDDTADMDTALRDVAAAAPAAAGGLAAAGNAAESSGSSAGRAYGWWGLLTKEVTLFGGVLGDAHLIGSVQLWHIALDGLFESAVALGEGLAALSVGIAAMVPASEDIYNHLKAVQSVNSCAGVVYPAADGEVPGAGTVDGPADGGGLWRGAESG